jgi:hypothetical protein
MLTGEPLSDIVELSTIPSFEEPVEDELGEPLAPCTREISDFELKMEMIVSCFVEIPGLLCLEIGVFFVAGDNED